MSIELLILQIVLALGAAYGVMWIFAMLERRGDVEKRLDIDDEDDETASIAYDAAQKRLELANRRKEIEKHVKLSEESAKSSVPLSIQLMRTGFNITMRNVIIGGVFVGALVFLYLSFFFGFPLYINAALAVGIGYLTPRFAIQFLISRRKKKFIELFPEALDSVSRGLRSGFPVLDSLRLVATEMDPPVSTEFALFTDSLRLGMTAEQALNRLHSRMPLEEVRFFCVMLMIQNRTGGNLTEALGNLSGVLRDRAIMKRKIRTLSAEARASAIIVGSIPFLIFFAVNWVSPGYFDPMLQTTLGVGLAVGAVVWMLIGFVVMRMIMTIKM